MMKNLVVSAIFLLYIQEAVSTHLETCDCHEIRSLINASLEQAIARLENKFTLEIQLAVDNVNKTGHQADLESELKATKKKIDNLELNLTSTIKSLLNPIKQQLDYHLPPPPPPPPPLPTVYTEDNPAESCKAIYEVNYNAPSDYYWIKSSSSSPIRVYCKMNVTCNMTGGWMRVAHLDMRNSSHQCPSGFSYTTRSSAPRRLCDYSGTMNCIGTNFTVHGLSYSHVYGRIIGYQNGYPIASYYRDIYNYNTLNTPYLFGVSLTHGQNPRNHIWSFFGAADETTSRPEFKCPCTNSNMNPYSTRIPSFIGNDYFCDTALSGPYSTYSRALYPSDPLWDGEGCGSANTCCSSPGLCGNNSPPWFIKYLPSVTTDDVELRLCRPRTDGSTPIEIVELYVQ